MRVRLGLFVCLASSLMAASAAAQSWPTRTVKVIIPFPAGGPTDTLARPVVEHLQKTLGQSFIIENRPGAGSTIGANAVAKSDPDGYTLLIGTNTGFSLGPALYAKAGYTAASFAPILLIAESPMVLCVSNKSGVTNVAELVKAAKAAPDTYSFASVGVATTTHLLGEWFKQVADLKMAHVPYRGSAPAMNDLVGGQVQVFFDVGASAVPHAKAGNIRVIMVLDDKREPAVPDVPTAKEAGYPDFLATFWAGMAAPAGTPAAIVDRLNKETNAFIKTPAFTALLAKIAYKPVGGTPKVFGDRIAKEAVIWKTVGDKAGVRVE